MNLRNILNQLIKDLDQAKTDAEAWWYLHRIHVFVMSNKYLIEYVPDNVYRVLYGQYEK